MSTTRANQAEDDRCSVADALTSYGADFAYQHGGLVRAIAHGDMMVVTRSPLIAHDGSLAYRPVVDYIERRRLVLADRREFNLRDGSLVESSWWMSRVLLRDGLAAYGPSPLVELEAELTR